jgi:hypothetical protein
MPRKKATELTFQQHIADFLIRVHKYGMLEQADITDTEHCIAQDQLWAFLKAMQTEALKKLAADYGTGARADPAAPCAARRARAAHGRGEGSEGSGAVLRAGLRRVERNGWVRLCSRRKLFACRSRDSAALCSPL